MVSRAVLMLMLALTLTTAPAHALKLSPRGVIGGAYLLSRWVVSRTYRVARASARGINCGIMGGARSVDYVVLRWLVSEDADGS